MMPGSCTMKTYIMMNLMITYLAKKILVLFYIQLVNLRWFDLSGQSCNEKVKALR